ncbi:hypothetical protein CJ214_01155 [Peptoniphilus lacrimalis]|uniref:Uncharacterized protein n=1 Tax=Gardnerella pickettii TaxID=2914924 RepID=A0ABX4SIN6_9BIFI|nr:hypothetical protein HMPREF1582_01158 [Gardnerella vaginalis JCP8151A]PKZ55090.1 hypothetical protein CYJ70_01695 [Gardnerella pickettii]PMC45617.1 hypothetical protein CJ214_01155 [Peptoniphilus lacrimalis]RFT40961.1 hypothetical protein CG396_06185 [Bifidobacteriaceae bacterium N170]
MGKESGKSFARISRANVFAAVEAHRASTLSGSANRSDFSRIMQLKIVDSRVCRTIKNRSAIVLNFVVSSH